MNQGKESSKVNQDATSDTTPSLTEPINTPSYLLLSAAKPNPVLGCYRDPVDCTSFRTLNLAMRQGGKSLFVSR